MPQEGLALGEVAGEADADEAELADTDADGAEDPDGAALADADADGPTDGLGEMPRAESRAADTVA